MLEEQYNWDKLQLGDIIRVKYDKFNLEESVRVVELDYDFENEAVNLVITNVKDFVFTDEIDSLAKLLHRNVNMVKAVDVSKVRWDGVDTVRRTLEDILSNPWETLGLEDDVSWEIEDQMDRLYDEIQEVIIPELDLPDFEAWFDSLRFDLESLIDFKLDEIEWPKPPEPEPPLVIEEFYEYITAPWSATGLRFNFVQQYTEEPAVQISLQGNDVENELDAYSFKMVAEHIRGENDEYIGLKVFPQGTNIPSVFSGKVSIAAVCTGVIEEES